MSSGARRLPTFLANLNLRLMPFSAQQQAAYDKTGFVPEIAFKTAPSVGKVRSISHDRMASACTD